ncbi:MAG: NfeD family protein [Clostridia bacterium]|nr:NfeD family protein [Clostridia bacterium]
MGNTGVYILWAAAIVIFAVLEGITIQLVSVWFLIGAVGALIAALCGANFITQAVIFVLVSVITLVATRPLVKKYIQPKIQATNADRCIGAQALVTQKIDNTAETGQVKVKGSVWTARTADESVIECGERVTVEKIEGVKLIVHK